MKPFKVHEILLDPKKITQIIADVTNACDKEYLADVTKVPITGKTILTDPSWKLCKTRHGYPRPQKFHIWYSVYIYI